MSSQPSSIRRALSLSFFLLTLASANDCFPQVELIGTVLKTSSFPEPADADYKDCLMVIQFRADRILAGSMPESTFLVVAWAFRNRKLAEAAAFREGDSMRLQLVEYEKVASTYDGIMRVDSTNDYLSPLYWATDWESIHRGEKESNGSDETILSSLPSTTIENAEKLSSRGIRPFVHKQRTKNIEDDIARMMHEVEQRGGYKAWREQLAPFRSDLRSKLSEGKADGDIFQGADLYLFSRSRMRYLLDLSLLHSEDAQGEQQYSNPFSSIRLLSKELKDRNVDLILVPIPTRAEVYPDKYSEKAPDKQPVTPHRHEFILELLKFDVEVLDLLPAFLRAREQSEQSLYRLDDPHWNTRGIKIAAREIADRLNRYPWVAANRHDGATPMFSTQVKNVEVPAALRKTMTPEDLAAYPPLSAMRLQQTLDAAGMPYKGYRGRAHSHCGRQLLLYLRESSGRPDRTPGPRAQCARILARPFRHGAHGSDGIGSKRLRVYQSEESYPLDFRITLFDPRQCTNVAADQTPGDEVYSGRQCLV